MQKKKNPKYFIAVLLSSGPLEMSTFRNWDISSDEKFEIFGTLVLPTFD